MKNIVFLIVFSLLSYCIHAQEVYKKSRKEIKKEKSTQKALEIRQMLENKSFIFSPNSATPMSGGSIQLNYSYKVEIDGDSIYSYLPFYGIAYRADYGATRSALDFEQRLQKYTFEKTRNNYRIFMVISNNHDQLTYYFNISEAGYATLNVSSIFRQPISFYGTIGKKE